MLLYGCYDILSHVLAKESFFLLTTHLFFKSVVSRSSAEAEYHAMASGPSELIWILNLLRFLGCSVSPARLYCDNQAALHIANNSVFHDAQNISK